MKTATGYSVELPVWESVHMRDRYETGTGVIKLHASDKRRTKDAIDGGEAMTFFDSVRESS